MTRKSLDEIQSQAHDLSFLLETIHEAVHELNFGSETDGSRNKPLLRVASLINIARDLSASTAADLDESYAGLRSLRGAA